MNENAKHNKRTSIIIIMASEIKKIFFFYNYRLKLVKKLTFFLILFMHYLPAFIFAFFVVMTLKQTNYCIMIIMILLWKSTGKTQLSRTRPHFHHVTTRDWFGTFLPPPPLSCTIYPPFIPPLLIPFFRKNTRHL